jgi:hypothetical protein
MTHGLQVQAAYTYSHSISDAPNEQNGAGAFPVYDAYHPQNDRGWSNIDQPHSFVVNYVWHVPFFNNRKGVSGVLLDGWQFAGITAFASGEPVSVCTPGDQAGIGAAFLANGCERVNAVAGQSPNLPRGNRTVDKFFNTQAFVLQPAGTFGTAAKNDVRLPGVNNWDFSIYKIFHTPWFGGNNWAEKSEIQFRAEFFNVWNHTQFSTLGTTFGAGDFGKVDSARSSRDIQFGLKFLW